jgi:hypothetical protein
MNWQEWQAYADNEANWSDSHERGLLKAEYIRDFILRLWFEEELDAAIYDLDFAPLFVEKQRLILHRNVCGSFVKDTGRK